MFPSATPVVLAASLAIGCARPSEFPKVGMPSPGEPGSSEDQRCIAEVAYEPGALPEVPGMRSAKAGVPQPRHRVPEDSSAPRAPTTSGVIVGERLGHDPGVAVGDRYMMIYTAHRYQIFDKAIGDVAVPDLDDEVPVRSDFNTLFSPLWAPRDKRGEPNLASINRRLRFVASDPLACNPDDPLGPGSPACVREFYDSRVQWDPVRRRFWIESAVRNHLWFCPPAPRLCNDPTWTPTQARRFIAIAVSRSEDPRKGFHRYVLVDEYADWPKMTITEKYLVLGHMSSPHIYVFDADKLAAGNADHGAVRVAKLDEPAFPGARFLNPVTQHGPTDDVSFLVATDGTERMTIYGLVNPDPSRAGAPVVLAAPSLKLGVPVWGFSNNAVYRDKKLYLTWAECTPGRIGSCLRRVHVLRIPVWRPSGGALLVVSTDPAQGYLDTTFDGAEPDDAPGDVVDVAMPVLDVTAAGDAVIGYARHGVTTRSPVPFEVRYRILYHGEPAPRPGVLVRRGTWPDAPDITNNGVVGVDLPGAQTDPDEGTVWISHAVSDGGLKWYRQVTVAVKP
jgi:hypothetical protein